MTDHTRRILIGVVVPLIIAGAGVVAVLVALPQLPSPLAVHWGPSGEADGFGSPVLALVLPAVTVLGYSAFALVVARSHPGPSTVNQRIILAIGPFFAALITVIMAGSAVAQAGLGDAREAGSIVPLLAAGLLVAVAAGVAAWLLLPAGEPAVVVVAEPVTLPLGADERASWMQRAEPGRAVAGSVAGILALSIAGGGIALFAVATTAAFVLYMVLLVVVGALAVGTLFWRVTVDRRGLRVRSAVGFPRFAVALADVGSATAIDVVPARDFGGWGLRWGGGRRLGLITRGGEALEVRRRDGRALVITVPHAATGAALLTTLAQRVD